MNVGDSAFLASFLRERDAPCPGCGYNLRGLTGDVCPECQQQLTLQVGLMEPKFGLWLAATIGAACGAGFNVLLFVIFVILFVTGWHRPPNFWSKLAPSVGMPAIFFLGLLWALLAFGRVIRRARTRTRVHLVFGTWVLVVAIPFFFASTIR